MVDPTKFKLLDFKSLMDNILLTSYLPRLFKKDMLTEPEVFFKNHLPEPRQFEWKI